MDQMTEAVCIVDGFSTGKHYAGEFAALGLPAVHVFSTPHLSPQIRATVENTPYLARHEAPGDIDALARHLQQHYRIRAVVPGAEPGVLLADALASRLDLATANPPASSLARRHKYLMLEQVRAAGLRGPIQFRSRDAAEALDWAAASGLHQFVVKPVSSGGNLNVFLCADLAEVATAATAVLAACDPHEERNTEVLVQERLRGVQYSANSVSCDGQHIVTEIWTNEMRALPGGQLHYDLERFVPREDPRFDQIAAFARGVLEALEIRHGPAHTELMMTAAGPALIETGARPQGSASVQAMERITGSHQVRLSALAYLRPEDFAAQAGAVAGRSRMGHVAVVNLVSRESGVVGRFHGQTLLRGLPSFVDICNTLPEGERLSATVDLFSCPGIVYLAHRDLDQLNADIARLRRLPMSALYAFAPAH